jgi:ribosomal protein S18 acetylase RimI-like enzyme
MKEGINILSQHGIKKLEICVFSENTSARALYESIGFNVVDFNPTQQQYRMELQV